MICTPTRQRISVVLPQPLGPSRPVILPRGTVKERLWRTSLSPRTTTRDSAATAGSAFTHPAYVDAARQRARLSRGGLAVLVTIESVEVRALGCGAAAATTAASRREPQRAEYGRQQRGLDLVRW